MTGASVRSVVDLYLRALDEDYRAGCAALFAEDALFEDPVGSRRLQGIAAIREFLDSAPPRISRKTRLIKCVACGHEAIFHYVMTIIGWREDPVDFEVYETIAIDEAGKIKQLRAFWNESSLMEPG
jgi:steroid delta-isomerase